VAPARNPPVVAETARPRPDGLCDLPFCLPLGSDALIPERPRGEHRARPRAEVLGRELLPRDLAEVGVDVARRDGVALTLVVHVLEQLVAGQLLALPHDA